MIFSFPNNNRRKRERERERDKDAFHSLPPSLLPSFAVPERWKGRTMGDKTRQLINRERGNRGGERSRPGTEREENWTGRCCRCSGGFICGISPYPNLPTYLVPQKSSFSPTESQNAKLITIYTISAPTAPRPPSFTFSDAILHDLAYIHTRGRGGVTMLYYCHV